MKKLPSFALLALAIGGQFLLTSPLQAITITSINWGVGAQGITGDTNVSQSGSLVAAYNFGPTGVTSTTVNGVTFSPFAIPNTGSSTTVGNYTLSESPSQLFGVSGFGSASSPASSLSSNYQTLLSTIASGGLPTTLTLSLSGLTSGQQYSFEFWVNDSANQGGYGSVTATSGSGSVTLDGNTTNAAGGLGQFAIGTFTALGTTQSITFTGLSGNDPFINAFELRAIPEPSEWAMLGLGSLVLLVGTRGLKARRA